MAELGETPTRKCIDCGLCSSSLDLFVPDKQSKYGRRNLCTKCAIQRNNKQPRKFEWKTDHQTKKRYGISLSEYKERMSMSSVCECCGTDKELCYDHDHETMKFRGVLCRTCNRSIGQLGDTIECIERALNYLRKRA